MIWKRPDLPRGAAADLDSIRETFETKRRKFSNGLLARDVMEGGAGVVVSGFFVFIWWRQGRADWPIGVALLLVLGVVGVFVRERLRARRGRLPAAAPLGARVDAYLADLRAQQRLMLAMWGWYLGPLSAAIALVMFVIVRSRPAWDIARDPRFLGAYFVFTALLMVGVWTINRRAVRQRIEPRIAELEKLRASLPSA